MQFFICVFLVALISYDVTNTVVFEWLRKLICGKLEGTRYIKCSELIHCHFCFSHWVAFGFILVTHTKVVVFHSWVDWFTTWAMVVFLAQPVMLIIDWTIDAMNSFNKIFIKAE